MMQLLSSFMPYVLSLSLLAGSFSIAAKGPDSNVESSISTVKGTSSGIDLFQAALGGFLGKKTAIATNIYAAELPGPQNAGRLPGVPSASESFRGLWVATVVNIDWPNAPTTNVATLKKEALAALDFAHEHRFNAIFLQVRPTADAFYPSDFFPWSRYLTGTQGTPPDELFDPLAFWLEEAHRRGIEIHAWINPYRITKKSAADPAVSLDQLTPNHPARKNPSWVIKHSDGNLYFNPGLPEVRELLLRSIRELMARYAVDGIHFDDYFYPDGSGTKETAAPIPAGTARRGFSITRDGKATYLSPFNDSAAFTRYGRTFASIDDWRRDNVNRFVQDVAKLVRTQNPKVRFGISPFAIWRNKGSDPLGSDTKGAESYSLHAADTRKWVKEGWVDYIIPQIYWHIGFNIADYAKLSNWWTDVVRGTGVDLYIGQAAYRMDANDPDAAWYGVAELERQHELNRNNKLLAGTVFFSYKSFVDRPGLAATLKALWEKEDGLSTPKAGGYAELLQTTKKDGLPGASGGLALTRPSGIIRTNESGLYFNGVSNPDKPLLLNGIPVSHRSEKGYFGAYVRLTAGKNTIVFSQEGEYLVRTIWRNPPTPATGPSKMTTAEITASSVQPQSTQYARPGETVTLSCVAPIGANVSVKIGGQTLSLTPASTTRPDNGAYPTTYSIAYRLPAQTGASRVVEIGKPVYTMTYGGKTSSRTAPAGIGAIMPGAPFYAEMLGNPTEAYRGMDTSGGTWRYLEKGMKEMVTGMTGNWVRLASGFYVRKSSVNVATAQRAITAVTAKAQYDVGRRQDRFTFTVSSPVAMTVAFDGTVLRVRVPLATHLDLPVLPEGSLFTSVTALTENSGNGMQYVFRIREGEKLAGFVLDKTTDGWAVPLKRHVSSIPGQRPLLGKVILLDPGHGGVPGTEGADTGAIGPMGTIWSERNINLEHAWLLKKELEHLGAKVHMTRVDDTPLTLEERLAISRRIRPDLFLSIHADSLADNADITKVSGFSVWYREQVAHGLGSLILDEVVTNMNKRSRRLNLRNFYVTRGTWTQSLLIELGFVPNAYEFEEMTDPAHQKKMVRTLSNAIVKWYAPN